MSNLEKFNETADEIIRFELRLREEDFTGYTLDGLEFEKAEVTKLWTKYKNYYENCSAEQLEKKKDIVAVHTRHNQIHKVHVKCINIIAKAKRRVSKEESSSSDTVVHKRGSSVPVHACDIDSFDGDYAAWPTFRDLFTAIYINNERLGPVEKLCYLFQKTTGDAREVNRNITVTADNFDIAWENLKVQYENRRVLFNGQLKLLYNMAPCSRETASEIKRLQREINNSMSTLRLYKIDVEAWEPLFVFHCSIRLPEQTLSLWEQSVKNKTEIPKWKEFDEFLTDRFRALESFSNIRSSGSQSVFEDNQQQMKSKQFKTHHTKVDVFQCKLCKEAHAISSCRKFLNMDYKNRVSVLRKFRYCFNCLKIGHMFGDCPNDNGCSKCKRKHHNLLHKEFTQNIGQRNHNVAHSNYQSASSQNNIQSTKLPTSSNIVQNHHHSVAKKVMLATAWLNIVYCGTNYKIRALIDPCSDESFISEKIQRLLKLPTVPVSAEVAGLGGEIISRVEKMTTFCVASIIDSKLSLKIDALVVPQVTGDIPTHTFNPLTMELPNLKYADPDFYKSGAIDVLLGGDVYPAILRGGVQHGVFDSLVAQETIFGWIVTGPTNSRRSIRLSHFTKVSIDEQLAKFWELEEVSHKPILSEDDKLCEEIFRSTTVRNSEGRYIVNLPFKSDSSALGPNRHIASSQFMRNEKSLLRNSENKTLYDEVLKEYLTLAHMEKIENPAAGPSYYLPHHGVFKPESTTTKLRVVFNASSATSSGTSLNDILHVGPVLQKDLVFLVLKWRFFEFVFNADISKMYRQVLINPKHANFQRIVFRGSPDEELQDYKLKTVTFGVNCAPYLALRTLQQLADDEERRFPFGARILRDSMYVDDALVGAHNLPDILKARSQLVDILQTAGFDLRKWTANSIEILKGLPSEHLLNESFLCLDDKSNAKTLGVRWNASADYFYFVAEKIPLKPSYTKREVLSVIARLFDPAGWLAPVIITAKILMQQMWLDKIDWDDKIKPVALKNWQSFVAQYNDVDTIKIPRWIRYSPNTQIEFHGFCDSSELAYAATLYARVQSGESVFTNLLVSKSKVAPIKKPSIPRLELCGAVLLAKLVDSIMPQFNLKTYSLFLWSDSTIVLAWLKKPPCSWKTFVANRVATILEKVGNTNWSHVVSQDNPADLATRGLIPSELKCCNLWWHGPEWLKQQKSSWPTYPSDYETTEEMKSVQVYVARSAEKEDILDRFSCLSRAIHVVAYMFRFFHGTRSKLRGTGRFESLTLSAGEIMFVRKRLFSLSQQLHFPKDFNCLANQTKIGSGSPLLTLTPFLDEHQIIRANGRLSTTSNLPYHERFPIILAYRSRLAHLYVDFIHKMVHHGGLRLVHSVIRHECWIIKAKILIKTVINNCKECVVHRKLRQGQMMAALPEERTVLSRPFANTGVDFAGPMEIKSFTGRYCRITKGYVCLFVCFSTKAIHLEAVSDLSTPAFLAALARFIARRGCPNCIFSDNGRNFVGAAKEIDVNFEKCVKEMSDIAVAKHQHQHLSWRFIPAAAPHMGGLWEAGVKSFKMHFKKTAGQMKYTFEEFSTLLSTIEACLNSRPIGPLSESVEDLSALTPGHFLIGSALLTPAEPEELNPAISIVNRWRKVKAMQHEICRRWKEEYLKELHKRTKWKSPQIDLQENDFVVLRNEPLCPTEWRLGRIIKIYRGSDTKVRVVDIKTQNGVITRPIHKLVLLPRSSDKNM